MKANCSVLLKCICVFAIVGGSAAMFADEKLANEKIADEKPTDEKPTDEKAATKVDADTNGDIVIGPDYKIDPDLTDQGNPKGKKFEFSMKLADSKIFKGDDKTLDPRKRVRKERKIWV